MVPTGDDRFFGKLLDLRMPVMAGGREGPEAEYAALYAAAGLRLTRVVPTQGGPSVVEGVAALPQ